MLAFDAAKGIMHDESPVLHNDAIVDSGEDVIAALYSTAAFSGSFQTVSDGNNCLQAAEVN